MKPQPKRWKMTIVAWLSIYPLITILQLTLGRYFNRINPLPLRTAAITIIVVPIMVFFLMPTLQKLFAKWLSK